MFKVGIEPTTYPFSADHSKPTELFERYLTKRPQTFLIYLPPRVDPPNG